jgi:hypothetical protein
MDGGAMENNREKQQLEIRIERLEKQNRRFKMGTLTLLIAFVSKRSRPKRQRPKPPLRPQLPQRRNK